MDRRILTFSIIGAALLVTIGLCVLTGLGTYAWLEAEDGFNQLFQSYDTKGSVTEQLTFDLEQPAKLTIYTEFGGIEVKAGDTDQIEVEIVKTSWQKDEEAAEEAAKAITVDVVETQNSLELSFELPSGGSRIHWSDRPENVDFYVTVPAEMEMQLETRSGDIDLNGTTGFAALISEFGDITAQNITGSLKVDDRNGNITLNSIEGVNIGTISSFGDIEAKNIAADDVSLHSNNGNLTLENIQAKDNFETEGKFGNVDAKDIVSDNVSLQSDNGNFVLENIQAENRFEIEGKFGSVDIVNLISGPAVITSDNGSVTIKDSRVDGTLVVTSEFDDFEITNVEAENYTLDSRNGSITLQGAQGLLTIDTDFGDVLITDARDATLDINARNGSIEFTGQLDPTAEHIIEGEFGNIILTIPPESSFDISMETEFGEIDTEFKVAVSGDISEGKISGVLNDGGSLLKIVTRNGNITILELIPEEQN